MADIADQAETEIALQERLMQARLPKTSQGLGPLVCACGELIPYRRRALGLQNCIDCAREAESSKLSIHK